MNYINRYNVICCFCLLLSSFCYSQVVNDKLIGCWKAQNMGITTWLEFFDDKVLETSVYNVKSRSTIEYKWIIAKDTLKVGKHIYKALGDYIISWEDDSAFVLFLDDESMALMDLNNMTVILQFKKKKKCPIYKYKFEIHN